eukprot:6193550-Pleurochrysis_carterae.AAC.1
MDSWVQTHMHIYSIPRRLCRAGALLLPRRPLALLASARSVQVGTVTVTDTQGESGRGGGRQGVRRVVVRRWEAGQEVARRRTKENRTQGGNREVRNRDV